MLHNTGPPTKLLYVDDKPVGQIQYYPETSIPFLENPDPKTLHVMCSFVHLGSQGKGYGTRLFNSLLEDVKAEGRYERIDTVGFDPPGCGMAQTVFWKHLGFKQRPEGTPNQLQYPIRGPSTPPRRSEPRRVQEKGVKIFYGPTCIFSHFFIDKMVDALLKVDPNVTVERVNMWENPEEAKKRGLTDTCIYVNGTPMKHSIFETEEFRKEAEELLKAP